MYRLNRLRQLIKEQGIWATALIAWSWIRWKLGGSQLPKSPASADDWITLHGGLGPTNPNPATTISVVMPTSNTTPDALRQAVASVREQTHTAWELIVVDDASPARWMRSLLQEVESIDDRIQVVRRPANGGVAAATETGIAAASGDYIAFLGQGDSLVPTALEWVSAATPAADLVYTDEAEINADSGFSDRLLKPSWSPTLLLGRNYISHLTVVRTSLVRQLGGMNPELGGSHVHDLLIRISEQRVTVAHVPSVLYLCRSAPDPTTDELGTQSDAEIVGLRVISNAIERRAWNAEAALGRGAPFNYAVRWLPDEKHRPRVKVVIPARDRLALLDRAVKSVLARTDHVDVELVIVDNGSEEPATLTYLDGLAGHPDVTVIRVDDAFNLSRLCNIGSLAGSPSDSLLFLSSEVEVLHRDWLLQMHGWFAESDVVAVGTELFYEDRETIHHAGLAVGSGYVGWRLSTGLENEPRPGDQHDSAHEVTGVTAACMLIRTAAFDAVGGFEEILPADLQDVDLCLKLRRNLGGRIIYEPMYPLVIQEPPSGEAIDSANAYTVHRMLFRWPGLDRETDPYFHPLADVTHSGNYRLIESSDDLGELLAPRLTTTLGTSA